jgi:hypothetical protein
MTIASSILVVLFRAAAENRPVWVLGSTFASMAHHRQPLLRVVKLRAVHYVLGVRRQVGLNLLLHSLDPALCRRVGGKHAGDSSGLHFFQTFDSLEQIEKRRGIVATVEERKTYEERRD